MEMKHANDPGLDQQTNSMSINQKLFKRKANIKFLRFSNSSLWPDLVNENNDISRVVDFDVSADGKM